LSKKLDKLEKALKKASLMSKNAIKTIAIPTPNRELGCVALGK
jgi:hypothetical protein